MKIDNSSLLNSYVSNKDTTLKERAQDKAPEQNSEFKPPRNLDNLLKTFDDLSKALSENDKSQQEHLELELNKQLKLSENYDLNVQYLKDNAQNFSKAMQTKDIALAQYAALLN